MRKRLLYLFKNIGQAGIIDPVQCVAEGLKPGLELLGCIGARNDGDDNFFNGGPDARDLRGISGAEGGRTGESETCQAFQSGTLAGRLVTDDNDLGQGNEGADIGLAQSVNLGEEGIIAQAVLGRHGGKIGIVLAIEEGMRTLA